MKRLFAYIKPYWRAALLAPCLMLLEVLADLAQPTLMARIIDQGIPAGDMTFILRTGILMIATALVGVLGGLGCTYFASIVSQNFGADLRSDLFAKVQSFSFQNLDQFKTGSLITRLTGDVAQVQGVVLAMLRILVRAPLLCLGGIIMALSINSSLAAVLLVAVPLLILVLALVMKKAFPLFSFVQKKLDQVNNVIQENLSGIRVVKAFVRADYENQRFQDASGELSTTTIRALRVVGLIMPVIFLIMNLSIVAIIWFGGVKVNNGQMLVGQVMAFINYLTQILFSLMMVAFMLMMVSRAKASAQRLEEVLEVKPSIQAPAVPFVGGIERGQVEFQSVSFRYPGSGGKPVLERITFTANPGQQIAILGTTGAGKTTLVNLIPRFYDVSSGSVLIDGRDVRDFALTELRGSIGIVPQQSILFSGTIAENIRWGQENATEDEVIEAAKAAQAYDFIMSFPAGFKTVVGQKGVNLSGGQKQRLAIARALLKKTRILILDDATSALDLQTEARIQEALKSTAHEQTCFIIAQRITSVLEADQIIVLEGGQISAVGKHNQLIHSSSVYREICLSQLGEEAV